MSAFEMTDITDQPATCLEERGCSEGLRLPTQTQAIRYDRLGKHTAIVDAEDLKITEIHSGIKGTISS